MQKKLEHFFTPTKRARRSCFIYDPSVPSATFVSTPGPHDTLITIKSGVSLFLRPSPYTMYTYPTMPLCDAALLSSNLQKAIRRRETEIAQSSTLALAQQHPMVLLRRLPIIYVEDVTLMDSLSVVVWLMMAEYPLGVTEIAHLLHFVSTLTECTTAYECDFVTERSCTRADVEDAPDAVVALYYRSLYGGMKGDMRMLINAVHHFTDHAIMMGPPMIRPHTVSSTLSILMEAIDYHPRPPLLDILHQKTSLDKEMIKSLIWRAESCINVRKPHTLKDSEEVQKSMEWLMLSPILDIVRMRFQ